MTGKQCLPDESGDSGSSTKKDTVAEASVDEPLLLKVTDLSLAIERGNTAVPILHHLNLAIRRGERWGIIGESGAGKSMTINVMAAFLKDGDYTVTGRILYRQGSGFQDLLELNEREQRMLASKRVSMILQDSINSLNPFEKAEKQWDETIRLHHAGLDRKERESHMLRQMERFSVAGGRRTLQKYPYQLSGGLKQRIAIAMSLESNAGILMADEPTTSLDSISQRKVIDYLEKICDSNGLTLLFVSHNLGIVKALCTHVAVMKDGRIVEQGPAEKVLRAPAHPYTVYLLTETGKLGIRRKQSDRKEGN